MGQRSVRVVVGQGDLEHAGSLRRMLERDEFDVVGDAANTSQLARVLTDEQPDVVVLDGVIGIAAVQVAAEIVPDARLVVVWPAAVMPIAGALRVDPSEVATTLTATVALAAGLRGLGAVDRPEWIERVKKDPATLREMLAARGALPARPSVTELQRRGHRLHPSPSAAKRAARNDDAAAAAVVPIGLAASQHAEPVEASDDAAAAVIPPAVLSSAWNRRLGIIALGGAAAAGALMIAIALGPHASTIVSAEPFPVTIQPAGGPPFTVGGGRQNQGSGNGGTTTTGGGGGGSTTTGGSPATGGSAAGGGSSPHGSLGGLGGGTGSGSGSGGAGNGGGGSNGPRANASHFPGAHGTAKPGVPGWRDATPGGSGDHNPHGGPPGHGSNHAAHGSGNGGGQAGGNGGVHGHGGGTSSHGNGGSGNGATPGNSGSHSQAGTTHGHGHANGHASAPHGNAAAHQHKR